MIDTGISLNSVRNIHELQSNVNFTDPLNIREDHIPEGSMTHGTICASIIKKYAPKARIHNLNVFANGSCTVESIIMALRFCISNNIKFINFSMGTNIEKDNSELKELIQTACMYGHVIIAATSPLGITTYPANYDNVLSVGVNPRLGLQDCEIYVNKPGYLVDIFASGQQIISGKKAIFLTQNETSYATAVVTAKILNMADQFKCQSSNKRDILNVLANADI